MRGLFAYLLNLDEQSIRDSLGDMRTVDTRTSVYVDVSASGNELLTSTKSGFQKPCIFFVFHTDAVGFILMKLRIVVK